MVLYCLVVCLRNETSEKIRQIVARLVLVKVQFISNLC